MLAPYYGNVGPLRRTYRTPGINRSTWELGRSLGKRIIQAGRDWKSKRSSQQDVKRQVKKEASTRILSSEGNQIPTGGGDSRSFFSIYKPKKSNISKLELTKSIVVNNSFQRVEAPIGQQNYAIIGDYYTDGDINLQFTAVSGAVSSKLVLKRVRGESLITNQENVNARITLMDVMARRDGAVLAPNPGEAFRLGFADNSTGTVTDYQVPGTNVYGNPRFLEYFKVLKTTEVILSPGAVHSHVVNYVPNKLFSHEVTSFTTPTSVANLTLYTFIVFHGSPINDITTQTTVSLSHIALDIVQKEQYEFQYAHLSSAVADINQTLPQVFLVAGATMQDDGVELPANEA